MRAGPSGVLVFAAGRVVKLIVSEDGSGVAFWKRGLVVLNIISQPLLKMSKMLKR